MKQKETALGSYHHHHHHLPRSADVKQKLIVKQMETAARAKDCILGILLCLHVTLLQKPKSKRQFYRLDIFHSGHQAQTFSLALMQHTLNFIITFTCLSISRTSFVVFCVFSQGVLPCQLPQKNKTKRHTHKERKKKKENRKGRLSVIQTFEK